MPNLESIDIHIQRSPHVTATDFDFLDSMIREQRFNIYAPELDGADETILNGMRKIANGDSKLYQDVMSRTAKGSNWSATFSALFMARKPIESFDVTAEQIESIEALRSYGKSFVNLERVSGAQYIEQMPARIGRLAAFITARDTIIAQNILDRLPIIIETSPKLRKLGRVGLLMTIGDNHQLIDKLLEQQGFNVTKNDIPVMGADEKAGLMQLKGETPTETDVFEAAAYSLVRGFAEHDSTYELRGQLNSFAQGSSEDDIAAILSSIQKYGIEGMRDIVTSKLQDLGIDSSLSFSLPGSRLPAIRKKETYEKRDGLMRVRTSIF